MRARLSGARFSQVVGLRPLLASARGTKIARGTRPAIFQMALHVVIESNTKSTTQHTMSITELEQRCNSLRNDLKAWEKQFAVQHNGKKAGRDDIKADVVICTYAI